MVFDPDDGASNGGGGASSTVTTSTGTTTGPPGVCTTHEECGDGKLCIFQTGTCADACEMGTCNACGVGTVCTDCATSACPDCLDCRAACAPKSDYQCDEDDPCPNGDACVWEVGFCANVCKVEDDCGPGNSLCVGCATSSCCGCKDCVSACIATR